MKKIIIEFPDVFVSVNMMYGAMRVGNRRMPRLRLTTDARAYKETVAWTAKMSYKGKVITGPVKISIWYWFKDKRRRDIQNDKISLDAMEGIIYKDDCQIYELHLYKRFDKKNPRTKIIIDELEELLKDKK